MQTHDGGPLPLPPGAPDLRGHEAASGRIRRLDDRVGQREQRQEQLMLQENCQFFKTNKKKKHITRLPKFCYHLTTM